MRRYVALFGVFLLIAAFAATYAPGTAIGTQWATAPPIPDLQPRVYLPVVFGPPAMPSATPTATSISTPTPTATLTPIASPTPIGRDWDPRLDQRGTILIPAQVQPGQGYWRLVKGVWYAENEPPFAGQLHIFVDTVDTATQRQIGMPIQITSLDGLAVFANLTTELKPGELYAASFRMNEVAPAYRAVPADGNLADAVSGMGMGSIEQPGFKVHTSYGFCWQWTIAPDATPTPSPTPTEEGTPTATPTPGGVTPTDTAGRLSARQAQRPPRPRRRPPLLCPRPPTASGIPGWISAAQC